MGLNKTFMGYPPPEYIFCKIKIENIFYLKIVPKDIAHYIQALGLEMCFAKVSNYL